MTVETQKKIPDCIPIPELAKRLHKSTRSVRRLCKKGLMPGAFKIGSQWFIREDSPAFPDYPQKKHKENYSVNDFMEGLKNAKAI